MHYTLPLAGLIKQKNKKEMIQGKTRPMVPVERKQ